MRKLQVAADILLAMWAALGLLLLPLAVGFGGSWERVLIPTADNLQGWIFLFGGWAIIMVRLVLALNRRARTTAAL